MLTLSNFTWLCELEFLLCLALQSRLVQQLFLFVQVLLLVEQGAYLFLGPPVCQKVCWVPLLCCLMGRCCLPFKCDSLQILQEWAAESVLLLDWGRVSSAWQPPFQMVLDEVVEGWVPQGLPFSWLPILPLNGFCTDSFLGGSLCLFGRKYIFLPHGLGTKGGNFPFGQ